MADARAPSPRAVLLAAAAFAVAVWAWVSDAAAGARRAAPRPAEPARTSAGDPPVRAAVTRQLADQLAAVTEAESQVAAKVADARATRTQRARVASRLLRERAQDPRARARVRAAVRWSLGRDHREEALLAQERGLLGESRARIAAAVAEVDELALPPRTLRWPAEGVIARAFGRFVHDRSRATLARRGVDLEVVEHVVAGAVAAGQVAYAGPIRGLDLGVLIDHGSYWSLVGKLGDVEVASGQALRQGQALGRAARKRIYLELRLKVLPAGIPIDPAPFFSGETSETSP
ncbi:MAG: peptidoglycan DD-metalloendopeptidase family protein [Kofleriaceae bacterium]